LVIEPSFLLLDEPFREIDVNHVLEPHKPSDPKSVPAIYDGQRGAAVRAAFPIADGASADASRRLQPARAFHRP
jgi:hypothetical protein